MLEKLKQFRLADLFLLAGWAVVMYFGNLDHKYAAFNVVGVISIA